MLDRVGFALGALRVPAPAARIHPPDLEDPSPPAARARTTSDSQTRPQVRKPFEVPGRPPALPATELRRAAQTRLVAGTASGKREPPTQKTLRPEQRARAFERLVEASTRTPPLPGTRMVLALRSEEWGALRIELVVEESEVRASVLAECIAARDAIVSQLDDLRRRLQGQGLELGSFQVSVGRQDPEAMEEPQPGPRSERPQLLDVHI